MVQYLKKLQILVILSIYNKKPREWTSFLTGNTLEHEWSRTILYRTNAAQSGVVRLPLNITVNVCAWGRIADGYSMHNSNAQFDGPTTIGSHHAAYKHVHSICFKSSALSTLMC